MYFILLQDIKCEIKSEADEFDMFNEQIDIKHEIQLCSDLLTSSGSSLNNFYSKYL